MMLLMFGVLCINAVSSEDYLEVNINQGPIRGYKTSEGIFAFYGIPYATAPTGSNKFKAPLHPPTWEAPFEAIERSIACPQNDILYLIQSSINITVKEDCLITNIYVPDTEEMDLPVVVYFYGGAYQYSYGESMPPKQLVKSKKVIALNFNYRLGAHGFLCLGTKDVPGNAAMKDQVALLRWVQENIVFFGGNPRDVTIAGCSAGGSSVDLHLISKMSRGLFNKAIPESSANVAAYSVQQDPIGNAKTYAKLLNFDNVDDIEALEEFYRALPFSLLNSINVMENLDSSVVFTPCIERYVGEEMFLDNDPAFILRNGAYKQVPMLYGFTDLDGSIKLSLFEKWKDLMNENFSDFLPQNLEFKCENEREKVAQTIKHFYFGNKTVDENTILNYINFMNDINFSYGMLKSVQLQTEAGNDNVFIYEYTFHRNESSLPYNIRGAPHCAQSFAVLDDSNESDLSEEYRHMKAITRHLWLNFITTGKPVPEESSFPQWPPAGKNRSPHMVLDRTLELRGKLYPKRAKFWDDIYSKYYRRPIPPTF